MKSENSTSTRLFDRVLALIGLASCLFAVFWSWKMMVHQQPVWLLPGLYLVEMAAVSVMAMYSIFRGTLGSVTMVWIAIGVLFGFAFMGAWSIGLLFVPSALIFIAAALISNRKQSQSHHVIKYAITGAFACICQILLMILIVNTNL